MDLRSLHTRLERIASALAPSSGAPQVILLLPDNGRGPDNAGPLPRVSRSGSSVVVLYDAKNGQPDETAIAELLKGVA
jgi:hypothetical protein